MKSAIILMLLFVSLVTAQQIPEQLPQQILQQPAQQESSDFVPDAVLSASLPLYVPAGYSVNVSLSALNSGRSTVENVVVDMAQTNSSVFIEGSTQRALGSLKPGEEKEIKYTLYSSYETPPGTYYVPVKVSYLRHNRPFSYSTGIGVSVFSPQPVFSIDIFDKPLEMGIGGNITVKITNAGRYPAYSAYATIRRAQQAP
ncbi:MAG: hypothetical protein SVE93_04670 [Candidatus Thermoplasmatota archaeon]|nr:hypothetical protein [Candidatus Thermoplasmatota archaeon]